MKLSEIVANYKPVYPEPYSWDITLASLLSEPSEKATIDYLVNILLSGGTFREPVVLGTAEFEEGVEVLAVVNGTHRLCAHMVANVNEVYVINQDDIVYEDSDSYLSTEITFEPEIFSENIDSLFDILRSFPLNENIWMESSVSSTRGTTLNLLWDNKSYESLDWLEINIKVESIIKNHIQGSTFSVKTFVETFTYI